MAARQARDDGNLPVCQIPVLLETMPSLPLGAPLGADLEAALVRELQRTWHELNDTHFKGALRSPVLILSDAASRLGQYWPATRTIELSRRCVLEQGWGAVVEVLKHEIAHQYVHEVLRIGDEPAHGPAFREVCARRGIDATAAGSPPASDSAAPRPHLLGKVAKLLALAESPNEHEAQAAMAQAQRLMLKYNLEAPPPGAYAFRHLGTPTGRVSEAERILSCLLRDHFFVEVIWVAVWRPLEGRHGRVLEVCGTPANLDLAEYVHAFLTGTAEALWREYRRAHGIRSNRDRRTYIAGVMAGFRDRLETERSQLRSEGLIWVGDRDLGRYYRLRHPYVRSMHRAGGPRNAARAHGQEAGRHIVLRRAVGGAPSARGRLLGPAG